MITAHHLPRKILVRLTVAVLLVAGLAGPAAAVPVPERVDLRSWQTPLRDQGPRATCIVHSSLAALEAAYKRAGYGDVRLSVEFAMYLGDMFYLEPRGAKVVGARENKLGSAEYGWSLDYVKLLSRGFAVPAESDMLYRPQGYSAKPANDPVWASQFQASSFNLDPRHLPPSALHAPRYFSVKSYWQLADPTSVVLFEQALARGYEVVWDFRVSGNRSGRIWQYTGPSQANDAAHSMLIVGYDRARRYFIVKNSWSNREYTYISYDYLKYGKGYSAVCITGVNPPRGWTELGFVGRWQVTAGNTFGVLDVYHLPGLNQLFLEKAGIKDRKGQVIPDRRVGTFYENGDPRRAFRVNGVLRGKRIIFFIDRRQPNLGYDRLQGKRFVFDLGGRDRDVMTGDYREVNGVTGNGQARKLVEPGVFRGGDRPIVLKRATTGRPRGLVAAPLPIAPQPPRVAKR
jgi:hypothetical protein